MVQKEEIQQLFAAMYGRPAYTVDGWPYDWNPLANVGNDYEVLGWLKRKYLRHDGSLAKQMLEARVRVLLRGKSGIEGKEAYRVGDYARTGFMMVKDG